jgi:hypothetical protein
VVRKQMKAQRYDGATQICEHAIGSIARSSVETTKAKD